jgi:hypothetical protein
MEAVITDLRATLAAASAGTKKQFLVSFAPIHKKWHMSEMMGPHGTFKGAAIGFLSFHHEVISVYRTKYAPSLAPGAMLHAAPPYPALVDGITDPSQFSIAIEGWHNGVHRNKKYGANFADPVKNIYMARFWELHEFIDEKFTAFIKKNGLSYDGLDHSAV